MFDGEVILRVARIHTQHQKSAFDAQKFVITRIAALAGRNGMHVTGGAAAEFVQTRFRIDRVILPVPVAVGQDHAAGQVIAKKLADFAALGGERRIGVIICLVLVIGTDDWIGVKYDLPLRIAREQRIFQPLFCSVPQRLLDGPSGALLGER